MSDFEIKDYDESVVVNVIVCIIYEFFENVELNMVNMDKCFIRIVVNVRKFFFTVYEFFDEFDIKIYICCVIEVDEIL